MTFDQYLNIGSILVSVVIACITFHISKSLSAKDKYNHEIEISKMLRDIPIYSEVILADVSRYKPSRTDEYNKTYYKQRAELYTVIPEFGAQFILIPETIDKIPVGVIPFEWIEYIRDYDSEDNKYIIVCRFKGIKYYKGFKSPFREINSIYENKNYKEGDPKFLKYTGIKNN
ncbi:MAG: hypothetical protein WCC74_02125 [Minisyncoccia bacterium]